MHPYVAGFTLGSETTMECVVIDTGPAHERNEGSISTPTEMLSFICRLSRSVLDKAPTPHSLLWWYLLEESFQPGNK